MKKNLPIIERTCSLKVFPEKVEIVSWAILRQMLCFERRAAVELEVCFKKEIQLQKDCKEF